MSDLSYIEISSANLISNIRAFKTKLPEGNKLIAVIKANAYGHGAKEIIQLAEKELDGFQVDDIDELREARKYTGKPIYVFGYILKNNLREAVELGGILGIYDIEQIKILNQIGQENSKIIPIHLKIDALLGRQGILAEELENIAKEIKNLSHTKIEAVYSHFSNIEDTENLEHARNQHELLLGAKNKLIQMGFEKIFHHISATSGFLVDQENNWGGAFVRLGIGMYGLWPSENLRKKYSDQIKTKPAMRWVTHLAQVKKVPAGYPIGYGLTHITKEETRIGVIPQGYSDGYNRKLSNNSAVLISGQRCPVLGRIAMNMFIVSLENCPRAQAEDEVILLGGDGENSITAEYLAEQAGTINYEIIARLSPLLPKLAK